MRSCQHHQLCDILCWVTRREACVNRRVKIGLESNSLAKRLCTTAPLALDSGCSWSSLRGTTTKCFGRSRTRWLRHLGRHLGQHIGRRLGRHLGRRLGRHLGQHIGRRLGRHLGRRLGRHLSFELLAYATMAVRPRTSVSPVACSRTLFHRAQQCESLERLANARATDTTMDALLVEARHR